MAGGAPNPLNEPLNPPEAAGANGEAEEDPNDEVVGRAGFAASGSGVGDGDAAPKPNPTGLPKLPLLAPPNPLNEPMPFGGLEGPPGVDPNRLLLPKGLGAAGLPGEPKAPDEKLPLPPPNRLGEADSDLISGFEIESIDASSALLSVGFPNSDEVDEGNALEPKVEFCLGAESAGLGDEERKSGTAAVEPKADFAGLAGAAAVVGAEAGCPKPENAGGTAGAAARVEGFPKPVNVGGAAGAAAMVEGFPKPVNVGVNPPPVLEGGAAGLVAANDLPPNVKLAGGVGRVEAGLGEELEALPNREEDDDAGVVEALGVDLGFSSNSFCTDPRKVL